MHVAASMEADLTVLLCLFPDAESSRGAVNAIKTYTRNRDFARGADGLPAQGETVRESNGILVAYTDLLASDLFLSRTSRRIALDFRSSHAWMLSARTPHSPLFPPSGPSLTGILW